MKTQMTLLALCLSFLPLKAAEPEQWTFVSIPDFLNFDIEYPQEGWEDALGFIIKSMKKEEPAFAMVAGDLVMGHWGPTKEDVRKKQGFTPIGHVTIVKKDGKKSFESINGFFDETNSPN